jgi:hypothetical protein
MNVTERATRYVATMPPAISGSGGHVATFNVAVALIHGFGFSDAEAWPLMLDFNARCEPSWSERELRHKLASAGKLARHPKPRGYLRGTSPSKLTNPPRTIRLRRLDWRALAAEATGRLAAAVAPKSPPAAAPTAAALSHEAMIGVATQMFNATMIPADTEDDLSADIRERLAAIAAVLAQRDARGRVAYTAAQVESCRIGLSRHAGTHPDIDAMLDGLNEAKKNALTWQVLAARG